MAHPLVFPGRYFFYPVGNTSAVSLLRDIAPEDPANVLLLGCGDPRNVLYSIFCETRTFHRSLDFTCCDIDPAVLARNVLLFTMVADNQLSTTAIWNIFFHFYLDKESLSQLTAQCKKLLAIGESLKEWGTCTYAPFVRMGTQYTLSELRRHWSLYIDMHGLAAERKAAIRNAFNAKSHSAKDLGIAARSAGPVVDKAAKVCEEQFLAYWKTGTTFSKSTDKTAATFLNPTFVYSLGGEGCNVHYGTDPVAPFHLAALFGNHRGSVSVNDLVQCVKAEFGDWCYAFHRAVSSGGSIPVIRLFVSEATALCRALKGFSTTGVLDLGIPVAQWKTQLLQLNRAEYGDAPSTFTVIDSSNLSDHIGLLNILIAVVPLLRPHASRGGVLYTESLLYHGTDATKAFAESLYADIHTLSLLLGISPIDYLSGFSSRSNTHEILMYQAGRQNQFHQMTTWKAPASGDPSVFSCTDMPSPVWDGRQLGTLLYDIYHQLFEQEDARHFWRINEHNALNAVSASNLIHYMRESFVLFLKLIREHFDMSDNVWKEVMERFIDLKEADQSLQMDTVNYQDLSGHLHLQGVHTVSFLHIRQKTARFAAWDTVPLLVRVILVVPREKFNVVHSLAEQVGTPILQCDVRGSWSHNIFTAVHAAFGTVIQMGTKSQPRVMFREDSEGWKGSSPIVVSFTMSAGLLTLESAENTRICLSIRSTPATAMHVVQRLGLEQAVFSANIMDDYHVHILPQPEDPFPTAKTSSAGSIRDDQVFQIGRAEPVAVELDEECELVSRFTGTVRVENTDAKNLFSSGTIPEISQVSPCVMRLVIGEHAQNVIYPIPVIGSQNKLRLARKSSYIEVIVPPSGPFKQGGMKLNPFPVVGSNARFYPWNIHRLNLSTLPILNVKTASQKKWLNFHLGSMLSAREIALRKAHEDDALMRVKQTLAAIFVLASGAQGGDVKRVFSLSDKEAENSDTVIFISDLRFDLPAHTVVCDGYVLPLTRRLLSNIEGPFGKLVGSKVMHNFGVSRTESLNAWKRLMPALVERCRSWKHTETCEYVLEGKVPLSDEMERDPLCSCGKGKDVEGMRKVPQWAKLAPFAVRVAFSPLFAVSYLERIGRDPAAGRCFVCRGKGKPRMMKCSCGKVRYCSKECQKKDWKAHKPKCKQAVVLK
ncbi:hypothetical protein C8R43DRAFT_22063 [Mycena crocata]|nr:hypothetical protein C8R43DRAFT_22063 [Mycena crocata]